MSSPEIKSTPENLTELMYLSKIRERDHNHIGRILRPISVASMVDERQSSALIVF